MINFIQHEHTGYPLRTRDNAILTDGTLAFAADWKSPGMIHTHKVVYGAGKPYIKVDIKDYYDFWVGHTKNVVDQLQKHNIKNLNIAGNSLGNLECNQEALNRRIADIMDKVSEHWPLEHVRSGGQNGVDLAGILWADSRGIPCTVLAPKGWMFRQGNRDICSEHLFIKRFGDKYDMSDIL